MDRADGVVYVGATALQCGFRVFGESKGFANARGEEIDEVILELR